MQWASQVVSAPTLEAGCNVPLNHGHLCYFMIFLTSISYLKVKHSNMDEQIYVSAGPRVDRFQPCASQTLAHVDLSWNHRNFAMLRFTQLAPYHICKSWDSKRATGSRENWF